MRFFLFIFFCFFYVQLQSQNEQQCNCDKNYIQTKISLIPKGTSFQITSHCVSILRLYLLDDKGNEFEKYELECIANNEENYSLSENVKYFFFDEKGNYLPSPIAKQKFIDITENMTNYFFKFTINDAGDINEIRDWTSNLE